MDGRIVGEIVPGNEGESPVFRIIRSHDVRSLGPNVRPCDHSGFVLDEKWSTVTCETCHERVDAFSALMVFAKWEERWRHEREMSKMAEKRLCVAELRRLSRLRALSDEERAEVRKILDREWSETLDTIRETARRIEKAVRTRRVTRR